MAEARAALDDCRLFSALSPQTSTFKCTVLTPKQATFNSSLRVLSFPYSFKPLELESVFWFRKSLPFCFLSGRGELCLYEQQHGPYETKKGLTSICKAEIMRDYMDPVPKKIHSCFFVFSPKARSEHIIGLPLRIAHSPTDEYR